MGTLPSLMNAASQNGPRSLVTMTFVETTGSRTGHGFSRGQLIDEFSRHRYI
jgi:hypothetical protein